MCPILEAFLAFFVVFSWENDALLDWVGVGHSEISELLIQSIFQVHTTYTGLEYSNQATYLYTVNSVSEICQSSHKSFP